MSNMSEYIKCKFGDVGAAVISAAVRPEASAVLGAGITAELELGLPYPWEMDSSACNDAACGGASFVLSWTLPAGVNPSDVIYSTAVNIYDGAGSLLRQVGIGEFGVRTLAGLKCNGPTTSTCITNPSPRNPDGSLMRFGAEEYCMFAVIVSNSSAVGGVEVGAWTIARPASGDACECECKG